MKRESDSISEHDIGLKYFCRFLFSGEAKDLRLVIEESTIGGDWKLFVNNVEIKKWVRQRVFDCNNKVADVSYAIKEGSTPTLNIIKIETRGLEHGLKEVPYLCGIFTCEYRYSHNSFPFLKGATGNVLLENLLPWDIIGYQTFSGTATYEREFELTEAQELYLDLGKVEDIADVKLDGRQIKILPWPPYSCCLGKVSSGKHHLNIAVTNATANRTRAARLTAGLLGPVKLFRM